MGVLLREVLRLLCGVNHWSYAVFWKIGYQNPKLLIWEDSYHDSVSSSSNKPVSSFGEWEGFCGTDAQSSMLGLQTGGNGVHFLVNKMMMDNQVIIVGEGIVGRAAFTGNHDWILANNYTGHSHPPEVVNEIRHQFSAGMQTIAVIPICPHGVVQLGSSLSISENSGFVNSVKSLILRLGCVPGALLSDNHEEKDLTGRIETPIPFGQPISPHLSKVPTPTSLPSETLKMQSFSSSQSSKVPSHPQLGQFQDNLKYPAASIICGPNLTDGVAQVIPPTPESLLNHHRAANFSSMTGFHHPTTGRSDTNNPVLPLPARQIVLESGGPSHFGNTKNPSDSFSLMRRKGNGNLNSSGVPGKVHTSTPCLSIDSSNVGRLASTTLVDQLSNGDSGMLGDDSDCRFNPATNFNHGGITSQATMQKKMDSDLFQALNLQSIQLTGHQSGSQSTITVNNEFTNLCAAQRSSGDDLYDILGVDFRNKLLGGEWNNVITDVPHQKSETLVEDKRSSDFYSTTLPARGNSDHLLEAVVSRAHSSAKQNSGDSNSSRTTVTKASSPSVPSGPRMYGPVSVPDSVKTETFDIPGRGRTSMDDMVSCSQTTSVYGSQLSSLGSHSGRRDNSVSTTGFSKKNEESSNKTNRKRLKPGENPRPRPKDRQMIQDRVKELRDIVPNGAKCSIDALLERTIKHMLFLQSVTKHADKLKQTAESKFIRKDGGIHLKDNFEGGATWAFEVGSQSMVCPIVVEDLNPPRQMLIEMLCEERGFFLEIAEMIRGMGLTILKGIMEARNDKIWAHFVVEANRDVTRVEIFMSLVHHLQQTIKLSSTPSANAVESSSDIMAQQHGFAQAAASIPATGGLINLQ
ncbi:unnamed protein product [Linum tenue]|uniref:BHLH domain-containing protein n=1 Tax=Linum tenue TaxID=586396 RepID=A0AAV0QEN2_9ROSI|nr:unnamed protein product [Linum tenue]